MTMRSRSTTRALAVVGGAIALSAATPAVHAAVPNGLVAVLSYDNGQPLDLDIWDNPYISGVALQIEWKDIEPNGPTPDWSVLDELFRRAAASNKWVQLIVYPGFFTPAWARGSQSAQFTIQYGPDHDQKALLPMPWDSTYLGNWSAFLKLLSQRYGANPAFVMVAAAGPTSVSAETTLPNQPDEQETWKKNGYTQAKYVNAWKTILQAYAADFPRQYVSIAGAAGTDSIVDINSQGQIVLGQPLSTKQQIVDLATSILGGRLALDNDNLDGTKTGDKANIDYIVGYIGRAVTGFQLRGSAKGKGMGADGDAGAALKLSIDNGMRRDSAGQHVNFIEIHAPDVVDRSLQQELRYGASLFD